MPAAIALTTCQAENTEEVCRAVAAYLTEQPGIPVRFVDNISWEERERQLDRAEIDIGWVCGTWYLLKKGAGNRHLQPFVAPVMRGARYEGRPVYFSDVVVRRDSRFRSFADLQGARLAYNEPQSYSGFYVVRHHLARLNAPSPYFSEVVQSGGHTNSLQLVLNGHVDGAAIDSTVLEYELIRRPELAASIRVVDTLGPNPIPPWVVFTALPPALLARLRTALLSMHLYPTGRAALAVGDIERFVASSDEDYAPLRDAVREPVRGVL